MSALDRLNIRRFPIDKFEIIRHITQTTRPPTKYYERALPLGTLLYVIRHKKTGFHYFLGFSTEDAAKAEAFDLAELMSQTPAVDMDDIEAEFWKYDISAVEFMP